jgi:hypothetical protein
MGLTKGTGKSGSLDVVVADPDRLEDGLVHQAPDLRRGAQVEVLGVEAREPQCHRQCLQEVIMVDGQASDNRLGVGALALDPGLLLGEQLFRNLVGIVLVGAPA